MKKPELKVFLPLLLMLFLTIGIILGSYMNLSNSDGTIFSVRYSDRDKLNDVINFITKDYVDEVKQSDITEKSIEGLLLTLDPHSSYIPPADLGELEESMHGNFYGIGVQFRQWRDTVVVIKVIENGPSQKAGLKAGDRLIEANGLSLIGISNDSVMKLLKGPAGTKVEVSIKRRNEPIILIANIKRGVIPFESVVAAYMINHNTAYFKIDRFALTTTKEFHKKFNELGADKIQNIVVDLQDNGGGLLATAISLTDEFLPANKIIVYTEGRNRPKDISFSTENKSFADKNVIVLVNESSASASEIFAGAIQDNDRGLIVGRRTFGKGLVQEQITLADQSAIRLTVARYYTATGRCIQKPYDKGAMNYYHEVSDRFSNGEMINADSAHFSDSLKYTTPAGRIVYGGGGIMPDIYVPIDTSNDFTFYNLLQGSGVLEDFIFNFFDKNQSLLIKKYPTEDLFVKNFKVESSLITELLNEQKVKNLGYREKINPKIIEEIKWHIKARLASDLYGTSAMYRVYNQRNRIYLKALNYLDQASWAEVYPTSK